MSGNGALYNITAAKPTPKVGVPGRVTGTVTANVSLCGTGNVLSPATWEPVEGVICPNPSQG
jgi:hypothetical protein